MKPILVLIFEGCICSDDTNAITPGFFQFLLDVQQHFDVHVLSSRSHQDGGIPAMMEYLYNEAAKFYREQIPYGLPGVLPLHKITDAIDQIKWPTRKPPAMLTIDDRAMCFMGVWPALDELKSFKPWHK